MKLSEQKGNHEVTTIKELITELKKLPNHNARIVVHGILNYPFQHAPIKDITIENKGQTIYLNVKGQ